MPASAAGYDLIGLQDYLKLVKTKYPDEDRRDHPALEQEIAYDFHAGAGDGHGACLQRDRANSWSFGDLFLDVSVGDAPT